MAFDGLFTSKMIDEIKFLENCRINKISQASKYDFLFTIRANHKNNNLLISCNPEASRIQLTKKNYENIPTPPMFCMLLRKHIEGGIIKKIYQHNSDRIITFEIEIIDELGFTSNKYMIFELMGRHSNFILCDKDYIIIDSYKRINPFDSINRTIVPTMKYLYPLDTKTNTLSLKEYNIDDINSYQGISKELKQHLINSNESLTKILNSYNPVYISGAKKIFYFSDLSYYDGERKYFETLSDLLDYVFYDESLKDRIKQLTSNIYGFVKKEIEKLEGKVSKLSLELDCANDSEIYKIKGELLMANLYNLHFGMNKINVLNYYNNEMIEITLDPLLDGVKNANKYYSKYKKMRNSIIHLNKQIELSKQELDYFNLLKSQLEVSNLNDALEIKDELIANGYIKQNEKAKKKKKISILTYKLNDNLIFVGKNNVQNDYLTNKMANSSDLWFHVKDAPSSHVVLRGEVNEETIRACAMIASYYSKYRNSSSVAVDYTYVKNVKKIPGMRNCFVRIQNQKTIYIDPSNEFIDSLEVVK